VAAAEWISGSYTKYVLNVTMARQSAVTGLKWFYSSFYAIRYGDNERPSIFPIVDPGIYLSLSNARLRYLRDCTREQ